MKSAFEINSVLCLPVLKSGLPQACSDLLAAGGEHIVVQFHLLLVGEGDITVESRLHRSGPGVSPALPKVNPEQKSNDEFPHCS